MANLRARLKGSDKTAPRGRRDGRNFAALIGVLIIIQAFALGMKAYDDRDNALDALETITQREALAVSEYASGKIDSITQAMQIGTQAGWTGQRIAEAHPDIEAVIPLADALSAEPETRLWQAGEIASIAIAAGERAALTAQGDMIVTAPGLDEGATRFALLPASAITPQSDAQRRFSLQPEMTPTPRVENGLTACAGLLGTQMKMCVSAPRSSFSPTDSLNLIVYTLLLAGPALALAGLLTLLNQSRGESAKNAEAAAISRRKLNAVLLETKSGDWSVDIEERTIWISKEAGDLLGTAGGKHFPFTMLEGLIDLPEDKLLSDLFHGALDKGEFKLSFMSADKLRWLEMRGHPDPVDGDLCGVIRDLTDVRKAISRARGQEAQLKAALEAMSDPISVWDSQDRLAYWNPAFETVFGLKDTIRLGIGRDTIEMAQQASILERRQRGTEPGASIFQTASGSWYKQTDTAIPGGGQISLAVNVTLDVRNELELTTKQKQLTRLVKELERSEGQAGELAGKLNEEKIKAENSANSKSAFLANMSHELRTPLNAINGFSQILCNEMYGPLGDERYAEYAKDILTSGQHLLDMINDILDMAKIEAGKMTVDLRPIDLVDPVDAAIRMIRRKAEDKGIKLSMVANEPLPKVDADHRAIRQMVLNLVSNAIKFTDENGEIRVTIDQKGDALRVAVRDNGVGIPSEALPRLTDPFEQVSDTRDRNYEGTGLGLALTKSFAEMHGGRLTIASEEGRGTQVSFFVPVAKKPAVSIDAA